MSPRQIVVFLVFAGTILQGTQAQQKFSPQTHSPAEVYQVVREAINYSWENREDLLEAAEQYAQEVQDEQLQNRLMRSRSVNCVISGDRENGLKWAEMALKHAEAHQLEDKEMVHILNIVGQAHSTRGEVYEAIRYYHQSHDLAASVQDHEGIFFSGLMESNLCIKLQQIDRALEVMQTMEPYYADYPIGAHKLIYADNFAECLFMQGKYAENLRFIEDKIGFEQTSGDVLRIALRLLYLMSYLKLHEEWDESRGDLEPLLIDIEQELKELSPSRSQILNWLYVSRVWFLAKAYEKAKSAILETKRLFEASGEVGLAKNIAETEAQIAHALGEHELAWERITQFIDLDDQVRSEAVLKQIETLRSEHETYLKNAEIDRLNLENQLTRRTLKAQEWAIFSGVVFTLFLATFFVMVFALWRNEKRHSLVEKRRLEEVEAINLKLKEAEANKDYFLAVTSHELKNPLNGIIGILSLLKSMEFEEEVLHMIEAAADSGDDMLQQINEILDYARIENGGVDLLLKPFELRELIDSIAGFIGPKAKTLQLTLRHRVEDDLPQFMVGDAFRIRQVLGNLVGNALKFTKKGFVEIRVSRAAGESNGGDSLLFEVEDSGIGLSETEISRLFHPFQQASSETERRYGGTGLGLTICSRLVELMQGEIGVHSTKGKGSVFWFTLPLMPKDSLAEPID